MSETKAELLITLAIIVRSTSYLYSSNLIHVMGPFNILTLRFAVAFLIMALIFHKKVLGAPRQTIKHSAVLGGFLMLTMACELTGFKLTDAGITSFLETTSIVLVPLLHGLITRTRPAGYVLGCSAICLAGVGFLTLNNGFSAFNTGCLFPLTAAFLYANFIIFTGYFAKDDDPMTLGIWQLAFVSIFGIVATLLFEDIILPTTGRQVGSFLALILACSCFGFTAQSIAQKYIDVSTAGFICALSPLVVTVVGTIFLGESLGLHKVIGGALMLTGIFLLLHKQAKERK